MPTPAKHHDPILDAAVTLFRRQGYGGTGVADIVELAGAPKGSLYHHFPGGKAAIAAAAVLEAGRRVARTVERLATDASSTADLLAAHARLLASWMAKSRYRDGCPITTVLLELAPIDANVTAAGRQAYAFRNKTLSVRLVADGFSAQRAERLAVLCTASLQGALVQARVDKSSAPLLTVADELGSLLQSAPRH